VEATTPQFQKYIFVCENQRDGKACCAPEGQNLRSLLKEKVKKLNLSSKIRVSRSGCLDVCAEGPNILLTPDNIWFKKVREKDIDKILDTAISSLT